MVEEALLDSLSRTLYKRLLERYPHWNRFAEMAEDSVNSGRSIIFKVPQPGSERFLWIQAEGDEVTVSFDKWHCHESAWLEDKEASVEGNIVRRSIELIEDIINERQVVIVQFRGATWTGSTLQAATDDVRPNSSEVAQVFSWRGTLDRLVTA